MWVRSLWTSQLSKPEVSWCQWWIEHLGVFPSPIRFHAHIFPEFVIWCHLRYLPSQMPVIAQNNEVLFAITPESICQALQIYPSTPLHPFSTNSLMEIYQKSHFLSKPKSLSHFYLRTPSYLGPIRPIPLQLSQKCLGKSSLWSHLC